MDGLRAIAVLAVILYHAFPQFVSSGFVGVDIFFVISGYLISGIIIQNISRSNFSYVEFYKNRILRIFPALLIVLVSTLICAPLFFLDSELSSLGLHTAASAAFVQNFLLWSESGYFDVAASFKPLLHIWSLGVEEQFYIVAPLVLAVSMRKNKLLLVALVLAALSLIYNLYASGLRPTEDFYSPLTRYWELSMGGLAYLLSHHYAGYAQRLQRWGHLFSIVGAALIGYSIFFIPGQAVYPGFHALLPVAGAFLIVISSSSSAANAVLALRPLVLIGLISYPLYLWHWPLLSLGKILNGKELSLEWKSVLVLISFVLAYLVYALVEKNVRNGLNKSKKAKILIALMVLVFAAGLGIHFFYKARAQGVTLLQGKGKEMVRVEEEAPVVPAVEPEAALTPTPAAAARVSNEVTAAIADAKTKTAATEAPVEKINVEIPRGVKPMRFDESSVNLGPLRDQCRKQFPDFRFDCLYRPSQESAEVQNRKKVLFVGDSHAESIAVGYLASNPRDEVLSISIAGCLPFINLERYSIHGPTHCPDQLAPVFSSIERGLFADYAIVIVARYAWFITGVGFGEFDEGPRNPGNIQIQPPGPRLDANPDQYPAFFEQALQETLKLFVANAKKVYVFQQVPEIYYDPKACIDRGLNKEAVDCNMQRKVVSARQASFRAAIHKALRNFPAVKALDPLPVLCDEATCYASDLAGRFLYKDDDHLSPYGSFVVSKKMLEKSLR